MLVNPAAAGLASFFGHTGNATQPVDLQLAKILRAVRTHLGMDVAFVSEFAAGRRIFRQVDASLRDSPVQVGGSDPLEESYCQRVIDGRLPEMIQDAAQHAAALELPVTRELPVGAHMSIPIRLKSGAVYGTFCCFNFRPDDTLNERDLAMMRVFAELAADQIDRDRSARSAGDEAQARIEAVLAGDALSMVFQPIFRISDSRVIGFESLARFAAEPRRTPDLWFNEAAIVGRAVALESLAIRKGLAGLAALPDDVYVSVNSSPATVLDPAFPALLANCPLDRVLLEVTEHAAIEDYQAVAEAVRPFKERGLRVAVDDAGAGYASFRHILSLAPDIIKLDASITRDIDTHRSRRALAAAMIGFANETGAKIVAEGVETATELATLRELGVNKAQGYFIGKPMPLAQAVALIDDNCMANAA